MPTASQATQHYPHRAALVFPLALIFSLTLAFISGCSDNTGNPDDGNRARGLGEDFWEKYDDVTDWVTLKLALTPEQEDTVLPILQENFARKKAMLQSYGFRSEEPPELTRKQREEIDAKMLAIRAETRAKLVDILDEKQLESLKALQREYHEEFRRRLGNM